MSYISQQKQSFGVVAKEYKKFRGLYNNSLYKSLFSLIHPKAGEKVSILDLGCGVGNSTEPILAMAKKLKINAEVAGCDPDAEMLKEGKKSAKKNNLPIVYTVGSAEKLPYEKESFDFVTSGASFYWFATKKALKEIQRTLKKNGIYFVFWTQNVDDGTPAIGLDLCRKYKWGGIPQKLRNPEYVQDIFKKSGFLKVTTISVPYVEKKTIPETIGLLKTNSTYALLSPEDKKTFIKEMTAAHKKALGKNLFVCKQEIHICYGTK